MPSHRKLAIASALFLYAAVVRATEFGPFDRADQIRSSDAIVVGTITGVASRWTDDRSAIVTEADVQVEESWKGAPEERITVRSLGGTVGTVELKVDAAATFAVGERVLLLLERVDEVYEPAGMTFGKYEILGAPEDEFAVGKLPPAEPGSRRYRTVSIRVEDLRGEVGSVLGREIGR